MFRRNLVLAVLASTFTFGTAFAQDSAAQALKANAEVQKTEAAIKAELSKPISAPLAASAPAKAPVQAPAPQGATGADGGQGAGTNRFITRPGTGGSKQVRTAPLVNLPEGPLGKAPADVNKLIGEAQKAGGQPLDAFQREINLPGLKKDDPSTRPFVLHTRNGVNEIIRLSGRLPNRIATPFAKPVVLDESSDDEGSAKVVGSDVYLRPQGDGPIGLFIVDSANTAQSISLTIIPAQDIPGQNVIIKLEDLRTVDSLVKTPASSEEQDITQPRSNDYVSNIRSVLTQAVRGKIKGFATVPIEGGVAKMGSIQVTPEYAFTGSTVDIYRYSIKNLSGEVVDLAETAFYRKGVKAVSFFPNISLKPGEGSYVFLLADKPKSAQYDSGVAQ